MTLLGRWSWPDKQVHGVGGKTKSRIEFGAHSGERVAAESHRERAGSPCPPHSKNPKAPGP